MIFSEAESLGSGGRVPALCGRFHALECLGPLELTSCKREKGERFDANVPLSS